MFLCIREHHHRILITGVDFEIRVAEGRSQVRHHGIIASRFPRTNVIDIRLELRKGYHRFKRDKEMTWVNVAVVLEKNNRPN